MVEVRGPGVVHVLSGLDVGGKERVALELARLGRGEGRDDRLVVFDSGFRDAERDLDPGDVPVELIPRGPGLDLGFARRLGARLGALDALAVHGHNDTGVFYAALGHRLRPRGRGRRRPRLVATLHARPCHATRGARWSTRVACAASDAVTVVSEDLRRWLAREGWIGSAETLGNGVDLERFAPDRGDGRWRRRNGLGPDAALVVHLGRFDRVKRHVDLLAAAERLAVGAGDRPVHVQLAGTGPELAGLAGRIGAAPNVSHVAGTQDVAGLLGDADLLVLCSEFEATPMVLLEALACGVPVVATEVGGIPALAELDPGDEALTLVPPRAPEALAAAIERLVREPPPRRAARRRAARRVGECFSWSGVCARYEALYRGGAEARGGPAR